MVGHKLGEFALTRIFKSHSAGRQAHAEAAAAAKSPPGDGIGGGAGGPGARPQRRRRRKEVRSRHGNQSEIARRPPLGPERPAGGRPRCAASRWTRRSTSSPSRRKKGAGLIKKLLESAIANAEHNDGADIDALKVKTIHVERGTFLRRFHARAKGRGTHGAEALLPHLPHGRRRERIAMGQKINPIGFRLAVNRNWASNWYANNQNFAAMLAEDIKVRDFLKKKLAHASVGRVADRAPGEGRAHHHLLGAPGRGDRQEGRGHRGAQGRAAAHHGRAAGAREHRGNPQARDRRAADRRLDRAAAARSASCSAAR